MSAVASGSPEYGPHRGTTVCQLLPFPGPAQCAEPVGFPGPRESANAIYTGRDCAAKKIARPYTTPKINRRYIIAETLAEYFRPAKYGT